MTWLKQSTAADVELGPIVDDTDFKGLETGQTLAQADCQLIKNGGAAAQKNDATSATHLGGGHYKVPLNATDTGTLGRLRLYVNKTGCLPAYRDFMVVPGSVYDALVGGSDYLETDVTQWTGAAAPAMTGDAYARLGAPAGASVSADIADIEGKVDDLEGRVVGTLAAGTHNPQSGDAYARLGAPAGASVSADMAAVKAETAGVKAKTDNLPGSPAAVGSAMTLANGAITAAVVASGAIDADALAADAVDEILDEVVEGSITLRQALRIALAALAGKTTGSGTGTVRFRDVADTLDRIVATVDDDANRTAVTLNGA